MAEETMEAGQERTNEAVRGLNRALEIMRGGKVDWHMIWDAMGKYEPEMLKEVSHHFWKDTMVELETRLVEALQAILEPGSNGKCMSVSTAWYTAWKAMQLICSASKSDYKKEELRQVCVRSWRMVFEKLASAAMNAPLIHIRGTKRHLNELLRVACAFPSLLETADKMVVLGVLRITIYHHLSSQESNDEQLHRLLEMLYFCIRRAGIWFQREVVFSMVAAIEAITDANEYHQATFPLLCASVYSCVYSIDTEEGSRLASVKLLHSLVNFLVDEVEYGQLSSSKIFMLLLNGGIETGLWALLIQRLAKYSSQSQVSSQHMKKNLLVCFAVLDATKDKELKAQGVQQLLQLFKEERPLPFAIRVDVLKKLAPLCENLEQVCWDEAIRHVLQVLLYNPSIRVRRAAMSCCEIMLEQPRLVTASRKVVQEILQVMFLKARDKDIDIRCTAMRAFSKLDFTVVDQSLQSSDWNLLFRHGFADRNTCHLTERILKLYCSKGDVLERLEALGLHTMWRVLTTPLQSVLTSELLIQALNPSLS